MRLAHASYAPRLKGLSSRRASIVSVLDIGTHKICCLIAKLKPRDAGDILPGRTHNIEVLGLGYQRARGIRNGIVTDLHGAEQAIRQAVDAAERMSGVSVTSLIVNVSCGRLISQSFAAKVALGGHRVNERDIRRVLRAGREQSVDPKRVILHTLPMHYELDGQRGIENPCGMMGDRLGVDIHVVTAGLAALVNLEQVLNNCHLVVAAMVASPYASGVSTLVDDELELGTACIDLGAGTTSAAVFADGDFIHADSIAMGGFNVTMDVAHGLSTSLAAAERIKTLHGSALASVSDERHTINVPPMEADGQAQANTQANTKPEVPSNVPRSLLTRIVRARVEEILETVRDRLHSAGFGAIAGRRLVLTGGASQLTGLQETARRILAPNVRLGRPLGIGGLPDAAKGPAFACVAGQLIYPQIATSEQMYNREREFALTGTDGYFHRVGDWLRSSF